MERATSENDLAWDFVSENTNVERRIEVLERRIASFGESIERINATLDARLDAMDHKLSAMQDATCSMVAMLKRVETNQDALHMLTHEKLDTLRVDGNKRLAHIKPALEELTKPSGPMRMQNIFWRMTANGGQSDEEEEPETA